jgi:YgiT-type zinc finger domain-containing protein
MCDEGVASFRYENYHLPYGQDGTIIFIELYPIWECDSCGEGYAKGCEAEDVIAIAIAKYKIKLAEQ